MASNVEIKARIRCEQIERIRTQALSRSSTAPEVLTQTDTFYRVPFGRLKLRRFEDGSAELIAYERENQAGPKHSSYTCAPCAEPDSLHEALARSLGIRGIVTKRREVIHVGQTRVHLDEVEGLGSFLELEVVVGASQSLESAEAIAAGLMVDFGVTTQSLVEGAYIDLLESIPVA